MKKSDAIANLVTALVTAQSQFQPVKKTESATIPTKSGGKFNYTYADLAQVIEATRPALLANGLAVMQFPTTEPGKVTVETTLAHTSGEYITESLTMPVVMDTPQSVGSAITYARRYAYMAALGLAAQDDDGAAASKKAAKEPAKEPVKTPEPVKTQEPKGYTDWKLDMILAGRKGMAELQKSWKASNAAYCQYARSNDLEWWEGLKKSCQQAVAA